MQFKYDSNGRILAVFSGRLFNLEAEEGESLLTGTAGAPATHYVDVSGPVDSLAVKTGGIFVFDVPSIAANGTDTATISNIPAHTLVTWPDGEVTEINDGLLEFAVDLAGTYTFIIDAVQYTKQEVAIEALA